MGDAGFAPQSILLGTPVPVQRPSQRVRSAAPPEARKRKITDTHQPWQWKPLPKSAPSARGSADADTSGAAGPARDAATPQPSVSPGAAPDASQNAAAPRRVHRKAASLLVLPRGWTVGKDRIGRKATTNASGAPISNGPRPLVDVVWPPNQRGESKTRLTDDLKSIPGGEKKPKLYGKNVSVKQWYWAKEYSLERGYDDPATGEPDMSALMRDSYERKMISAVQVHALILWYNLQLKERERTIARLMLAGRAGATKRGAPATSTTRKRRSRVGDGDDDHAEEEEVVIDAFASEPAKRGAGGRKPMSADGPQPDSIKKRGRRLRLAVYTCLNLAALHLGGPAGLSLFMVMMLRSAVCRTGLVRRHIYFSADVLRMIVDDPALRRALTREIDGRRRPKLSAFQAARFNGVTFASIDRLRFAMNRAPGHSTLIKADKEWERMLERRFCPSGPSADAWWTTRTDDEQHASSAADRDLEEEAEEEDDDDDVDPAVARAAEEAARAPADELDRAAEHAERMHLEALQLLRTEFPKEADAQLENRWEAGADLGGVFADGNVVHICAVGGSDELLGFVKAIVTEREIFIDELLTGTWARGQGLTHHLLAALLAMYPSAPRLRLQVAKRNKGAQQLYAGYGFERWLAPTDEDDAFYGVKTDHDGRFMFMAVDHEDVATVTKQGTLRKPLAPGTRLWRQSLFDVDDAEVDYVRSNPGGADASPAPQRAAQPPARRARRAQSTAGTSASMQEDAVEPVLDDEQRQEEPPKAAKQPAKWHGSTVKDALIMILIATGGRSVIMPGHVTQRIGVKLTCDAATLKNAPKFFRACTSVIVQVLCYGVKKGDWRNAVKHMVVKAQSCKNCFVTGIWFGKDDATNCREHLAPQMEEIVELEESGFRADLPMERPPFTVGLDEHGRRSRYIKRDVHQHPDTKANAPKMKSRNVIARLVQIFPVVLFVLDGATTGNVTGATVRSRQPDPFSDEEDTGLGLIHQIWVIRPGESLADLSERISPGCSNPDHRDHWVLRYVLSLNDHKWNSELQAITREPARQKEVCGGVGGRARQTTARMLADDSNNDGRTDERLPYESSDLRAIGYDHDDFVPAIDGGKHSADAKAKKLGAVRMPVQVEHCKRELPAAVFGKPKAGGLSQQASGAEALMTKFGLCIMHCAMRTIESCLTHLLKQAMDRFVLGKKRDVEAVDAMHEALRKRLSLRKLITVNKEGKLNKPSINGEEVQIIFKDVLSGDSELIKAFRAMYKAMELRPEATKIEQWVDVLTHWAESMRAAYVMRATQADRDSFRKHAKFYVRAKANIRSGIITWYDWQMFSIMSELFDRFMSLRLISQEGMEACQSRQNMFMRLCHHFANVGRIPRATKELGKAAVLAYMSRRASEKKTPEKWLWLRNVSAFWGNFLEVFENVTELVQKGEECDWETELVPEWRAFTAICLTYAYLRCRNLFGKSDDCPERTIRIMRSDAGMSASKCGYGETKSITIEVTNVHSERIAEEIDAYYAPVPCEADMPADIDGQTARRMIQAQRRKRWKERDINRQLWKPWLEGAPGSKRPAQ